MVKVALVSGGHLPDKLDSFDYLVAVDMACWRMIERGYDLDLAVGDFDSVSPIEKAIIKDKAAQFLQAPPEKNDTDTELALKTILTRWPQAEVTIYGAFGGRLDHELANLFLPSHPDFTPFMRQIRLVDDQNDVAFYPKGEHLIQPHPDMTYVSFLLEGEGQLEIANAKYPLHAGNYFQRKSYGSNEFVDGPIIVTVPDGYLVVLQTRDRR